jgi:acyl-homoserine-lactone acylase
MAHSKRIICLEFLGGNDIQDAARAMAPGSNSYAIGPSKSASKNSMLVTNPHLPWGDFFTFFEAHLTAPGFDVYGVSLVGFPNIVIGFNQLLGWTHTVNTIDASDRYELQLQDKGYLLDGKVEAFDKKTVSLKVRQPSGEIKELPTEFLYAKQGPVIGAKNGKAIAVRIAGMEQGAMTTQYHRMGKARNLKEFEAAVGMMQNPMFNVIYADKAGNILYLFNGNVPRRSEGDWNFWSGTVDGRSSKYIWTSYHRMAELPKSLNPPAGFVQNANDPPWTSTFPMVLKPSDFPSYMAPRGMGLRPQRAVNLIKDDASITFEELLVYKLNTGMEAADRFLEPLLSAVAQSDDTTAKRAATVLQRWDKSTNSDSRGAVLFARWFDQLDAGMAMKSWDATEPVTTPSGLKDTQKAVALLAKAAQAVEKDYGSIDVAWGDVNRFKVGAYELPGNGGPDRYGIFRTMHFKRAPDGKNYAFHGDSYVAVTEFGPTVKAQVLLSYGNASQPGSKHIGDQLPLLSQKKMRTALLKKEDVLRNTEEREQLQVKAGSH